jgi:hypothetical protein
VIRFIDIAVGTGQPCGCARCHGEPPDATYRATDAIVEEIASACATWEGRPGPNLRLTGAEPFGHPELPSLVSAAISAGCSRLGVDTDGVALRSAANAGGALMAGVRHVRFRLLGGSPGLHDTLAGAPGVLDLTIEGIRSYRSMAAAEGLPVSVTAIVPVCRHNVHDLPAAAGLAVECGVDTVVLSVEGEGVDLEAAAPWITAACDTGVVNGVWVEVDGMPFCLLPGYDLHLSDAVQAREGSKSPVCRECALDCVCAGAPPGASGDQLAKLAPPAFAAVLAPSVARARAGEVT